MGVRIKFPAGGQVIRVPLTISIPNQKAPNLNELEMYILAHGNLPLSLRVKLLCDSIYSTITASGNVSTSVAIALEHLTASLIHQVSNRVPAWIRIDEDITGAIGMVLRAFQSDANVLIDLVGESAFENGMTISVDDAVEAMLETNPNLVHDAGLILQSGGNVEIASIRHTLELMSNQMMIDEGSRITLIGELDPEQTGDLDPNAVPDVIRSPIQPYLEIGIVENDEGRVSLELRACDDVKAIRTEPVMIGFIDPNKIGELDPDHIPDGRTV